MLTSHIIMHCFSRINDTTLLEKFNDSNRKDFHSPVMVRVMVLLLRRSSKRYYSSDGPGNVVLVMVVLLRRWSG